MDRKKNGFTVVELVMVMAILGVMVAVAMPRFFNLKSNANIALIKAAEGAVRTASANARIKCVLTPGCNVSGGFVGTVDGVSMRFWNGHLDAGENINGNVHQWVQAAGFDVQFVPNAVTRWRAANAANPAACYVEYKEVATNGGQPGIASNTSGC